MKPRSFKLVKKYPNSENIGSIWTKTPETKNYWYMNCYLDPADVENNPEFFEEIIEKDYEILSVQNCLSDIILEFNKSGICIKRSDDCNLAATLNLENCLKSGCKIFSIHRLSDNEVFSLGDELVDTFNRNHGKFTLKEIEFEKAPCDKGTGKLSFVHTHTILGKWIPLERLERSKPVLFVTHDGYDMYEGDDYLAVDPEDYSLVWSVADQESLNSEWLKFASRKPAEEYVFWNAPVLSLEDVASIYPGINKEHNSPSHQAEQLKALVKSRL